MISRILVAGIGNVLLQDDGFGPHAISGFECEYEIGVDAELIDLGTPGPDFVDYIADREVLIILDALACGGEPGEIVTFTAPQIRESLPNIRLSAHQPCLQETLFAAERAGRCPGEVLLVGVVGSNFDVSTELGPEVADAMPKALELIADMLRQRGVDVRKRDVPLPRTSWWDVPQPASQPTKLP